MTRSGVAGNVDRRECPLSLYWARKRRWSEPTIRRTVTGIEYPFTSPIDKDADPCFSAIKNCPSLHVVL